MSQANPQALRGNSKPLREVKALYSQQEGTQAAQGTPAGALPSPRAPGGQRLASLRLPVSRTAPVHSAQADQCQLTRGSDPPGADSCVLSRMTALPARLLHTAGSIRGNQGLSTSFTSTRNRLPAPFIVSTLIRCLQRKDSRCPLHGSKARRWLSGCCTEPAGELLPGAVR